MDIPAFCDSCGTAFPSGIAVSGRVTGLTLQNNLSGPCPRCGGMGRVLEGTFDFIDGVLKVLSSPQRTVDDLRRLAHILGDVRRGDIDEEEAVRRVGATIPQLYRLLLAGDGRLLNRLMLLVAVIGVLLQAFGVDRGQTNVTNNFTISVGQPISQEQAETITDEVFRRLCQPAP